MTNQFIIQNFANLSSIIDCQLKSFPEHASYLSRRYQNEDIEQLRFDNEVAKLIVSITNSKDGLPAYCLDYKFLTQIVLEEEIYFRRNGKYRLSTFAEAEEKIYSNREYMTKYMNGLLLTQLWWRNHSRVLRWYVEAFLAGNRAGVAHLEIGPGHGLYLYFAGKSPNSRSITAWDVSPHSIELARHTLTALNYSGDAQFELVNMFDAGTAQFDSITFSEVLEHLEDPDMAMSTVAGLLTPGGRVFVHAPVNSPAPDHLTLFRTPEEIIEVVSRAGLEIEASLFEPNTTARSLENARKYATAISVAVIGKKPN